MNHCRNSVFSAVVNHNETKNTWWKFSIKENFEKQSSLMHFELLSGNPTFVIDTEPKHLSHHIQWRSPVGISNLSWLDIQPNERFGWALLWFSNLVTGWRAQECLVKLFGPLYDRDPRNWWWGLWHQIEHTWTVQHGNLPELRKTLTSHPPAKIWADISNYLLHPH